MSLATTAAPGSLASYTIPDDMLAEFQFIKGVVPLYAFNAKDGVYRDRSIENYNPEEHPTKISGCILGLSHGQAFLAKEGEGWSQKWLCRTNNITKPPILHPDLKDNEVRDLLTKGAGKDCSRCQLKEFVNGKNGAPDVKPVCGQNLHLLFLTEDNEICLLSIGGTSFKAMDNFLAPNFTRKMRFWWHFKVTLGREHCKNEKGETWWRVKPALGEAVNPSQYEGLANLRAQYIGHIDKSPAVVDDPEPQAVAAAPTASAPPASTATAAPATSTTKAAPVATPAAPAQTTFQLDEDGNPIWGDEVAASDTIPFD